MFVLTLLLSVGFMAGASEGAAISSISMERSTLSLEVGETASLRALIDPDNATGSVRWSIGDRNVVSAASETPDVLVPMSITQTFSVRAVSAGSTTVTCESSANSGIYDTMTIYVGSDYDHYEDYEDEGGGCSTFGFGVGILALAALVLLKKRSRR
jgi:uncharacterized protein YjdB